MNDSPPAIPRRRRLPGTPAPMRYFTGADECRLAADEWGDPTGPLVILQHGGGQTRHAWKGAGETLGLAGYHAIALDARGHGDSDWAPDGTYGQDVMVADLGRVLRALGDRQPVLVGASMGGGVSLVACGEHHVDAAALVLVDMGHRLEREGTQRIQAFMSQKPEGFDSLSEVADAIASYQPHRRRPDDLAGLAKNVRLGDDGRFHWHWDPRFRSGHRDFNEREARLGACARALRLPTLLVRGGLSDVLSEAGAREFLELCPHSEYVNVSNAGHMVAGDRNDVFAHAVVEFLSRVLPVRRARRESAHPRRTDRGGRPPGDASDVP